MKGEIIVLCSYDKTIYPRPGISNDSGYMVALYKPIEKVIAPDGSYLDRVKVVGYMLPTGTSVRYDMAGQWEKTKYGYQYSLSSYSEVIQHSRDGIIGYLSSGLIKGIGSKTAERIYDMFGNKALDILDNDLGQLLKITGISESKLEKIKYSYMAYRGARDVVALLTPYDVSPARAVKIYEAYGSNAAELIKENPYRLCEMHGIGFTTADRLAQKMGLNLRAVERIEAGLLYALQEAETTGHLCLPKDDLIKATQKLLMTEATRFSTAEIEVGIDNLTSRSTLVYYQGYYYRWYTERAERQVAARIQELLAFGELHYPMDLDSQIKLEEQRLGIKLEKEQRHAVKTCLTNHLCIVTGGPGTGKTIIQRITLNIYKRCFPDAGIVCCAPTGRAARRLNESTGHPSSTIHKALGLMASDDFNTEPEKLEADLVIVDEVSMVDIFLAQCLTNSLPYGCQLIMVGDADQLPSVGPGAVLKEMIDSKTIPVVRLEKVYRQGLYSRIPINAALIRGEQKKLEYGPDFQFISSDDIKKSADILEELYLAEMAVVGIDNVVLLSPFRKNTETGVNALNNRLREKINPAARTKPEYLHKKRLFRTGDRVMQTKNSGDISNGDLGFIRLIKKQADDTFVCVDFDGRIVEYDPSELEQLDLAYASTIHKSQGSEYHTVLINLQTAHYVMLRRQLIYTAITRARKKVIIVGEPKALYTAISRADTEKRNTLLACRLAQNVPALARSSV